MFVFPLAASLVSFIFAVALVRQYVDRRKPYQLAWAAALLLFGIGAGAEVIAALTTWSPLLAKVYYVAGAALNVGVLALGSLYVSGDYDAGSPAATFLLGRRFNMLLAAALTFLLWFLLFGVNYGMLTNNLNAVMFITALYAVLIFTAIFAKDKVPVAYLLVLLVGGAAATYAVVSTTVRPDPELLSQAEGWKAINRTLGMRSGALSFSVIGTFVVIVGAIQSAVSLFRKQIMRERAIGNLLIGGGVLIVASGGFLGGLFEKGGQAAISIPMALGVTVMFIGFLQAGKPAKPGKPSS